MILSSAETLSITEALSSAEVLCSAEALATSYPSTGHWFLAPSRAFCSLVAMRRAAVLCPPTPCHNTGLCPRPQGNRAKQPLLTARISPTHLQVDHLRRAQRTEGGVTTGQEVLKGVRKQPWGAASKHNSSMVSASVAALVSLREGL